MIHLNTNNLSIIIYLIIMIIRIIFNNYFLQSHIFKQNQPQFYIRIRRVIKMMKIDKRSVLTLLDYDLQSLSQYVKIADNQYYLAQLYNKNNKKTIYTWQEISVLKSRYFKFSNDLNFNYYLEKGKQIQILNKWPEKKMIALIEIKEKFWDEQSQSQEQVNYQFQDEQQNILSIKQQFKKSKRKQKSKQFQRIKKYEQKQELNVPIKSKRKQKDYSSLKSYKIKSKINKIDPILQDFIPKSNKKKEKINDKLSQRSFRYERKQLNQQLLQQGSRQKHKKTKQQSNFGQFEQRQYLRIINLKRKNHKQINYLVENILGQTKFLSGSKLKKTHLFQVIVFLEKCLKIRKKQLINQNN